MSRTTATRAKKATKRKTTKRAGRKPKNSARRAAAAPTPIATMGPDPEAMYPIRQCIDTSGKVIQDPKLDPELMKKIMTYMIWNRELDERLTKLQRQGRIGFHIGSIGEEALMIGTAAALEQDDWVVPCYREMGVALYRGMALDEIVGNMFGNDNDPVKGRQMPCHYVDQANNFLSISSPVGTQIPQAAGVGWAMKLEDKGHASLVYFGDGATSEGDFHVGMNFAGVYQAATVFVCRNNMWAISTPLSTQTASTTIAQKAIAYGMLGERVDGNDPLAVYAATKDALDRARSGGGPTLLEMCTYRIGAHSTSDDPRSYRSQDEVDPWLDRDPITRFGKYLARRKLWSQADTDALVEQIAKTLAQAIELAESTPTPALSTLFENVYAEVPQHLREQQRELEDCLAAGYVPKKH